MEFAPFFSKRSAPADHAAPHRWRPALPPIDRPILELAAGRSAEPGKLQPTSSASAPNKRAQ